MQLKTSKNEIPVAYSNKGLFLTYFTCGLHLSYGFLPGCDLALCSYLKTQAEEIASV